VHRLKREFPALALVTNGGLTRWDAIERELAQVDGVMLGRAAYHDPWLLGQADWRAFADGSAGDDPRRGAARADPVRRSGTEARHGTARDSLCHVRSLPRAVGRRRFRQILSDSVKLKRSAGIVPQALAASSR